MACERHKQEIFELSHSKGVVKTAASIATLKADDETKVRRIFTFKTLIYVQYIVRVRFSLRFLLILLVSILFSVSGRFFVTSDC